MKKKHKKTLKKGLYIFILIIFTIVSILPAVGTIANNQMDYGIPMDEESIKEMFGEDARYNPATGEITYSKKEQ